MVKIKNKEVLNAEIIDRKIEKEVKSICMRLLWEEI